MDFPLLEPPDPWPEALSLTASSCTTYFHYRNPHWIALGSRIWAGQMGIAPIVGHRLCDELMRASRHEIRLRADFTRRTLGELAQQHPRVPAARVLVDCTRTGAELMREGCRDVEADAVRTARFVPGMDVGAIMQEISDGIARITEHLLRVRAEAVEAAEPYF